MDLTEFFARLPASVVTILQDEGMNTLSILTKVRMADIEALKMQMWQKITLREEIERLQEMNGGGPLASASKGSSPDLTAELRKMMQGLQINATSSTAPRHEEAAALRIVDFVAPFAAAEEEVTLGGGCHFG